MNKPVMTSLGSHPSLSPSNTPAELTASEFLRAQAASEVSALEYVQSCLDRIERYDGELKAWKVFDREKAEAKAKGLAARRGEALKLGGVPVGVKDIFNTYDFPTSMGSPIMENYTPGNDARVVSNIRLDGGVVMGKCVTAEFAVHHPGETRNPWSLDRSPGTSSSGSAVAVAARMVPVALASQTAGSIIRPASYCGIAGFKPSFGLVPRTAMLKTTDTLDTVGFLARSVEDLELLFERCRVRGHNYPSTEAALEAFKANGIPAKWKVGLVRGPKTAEETAPVSRGMEKLAQCLSANGCSVEEFHLPEPYGRVHHIHEVIYRRALAYYFKSEWTAHEELFSAKMAEMIEGGLRLTPEEYLKALEDQAAFRRRFADDLGSFDILICPSTADEAPIGLDAPDLPDHCLIWTFVGAPSLGLPALRGTTGLPVGVQIVARRFDDVRLLAFAKHLEAVLKDAFHAP